MARKSKRLTKRFVRKHGKRKWQKPMRIVALIVSAIQDLRETKGSSTKKIIDYIKRASNLPEKRIARQVNTALRRGVGYGILRKYRGNYFLPIDDELDRANRIALRFSRIPSLKRSHGGGSVRRKKTKKRRIGGPRKIQRTKNRKKILGGRRSGRARGGGSGGGGFGIIDDGGGESINENENNVVENDGLRKSRSLPFSTVNSNFLGNNEN